MRGLASTLTAIALVGCFDKPPRPNGVTGDGGSGDGDNGLDAVVAPNYAFVTNTPHMIPGIHSVNDADTICMTAASAAGRQGTYLAWMSSDSVNAQNRIRVARGWVRTDGKPFANDIEDVVTASKIFYPLRCDEAGGDVVEALSGSSTIYVATGTGSDGNVSPNGDCTNLTGTGGIDGGYVDAEGVAWTSGALFTCPAANERLYCFGIDRVATVAPPPPSGPITFVTQSAVTIGSGVSAFDTACVNDATGAGLTGTFVAVVASETESALHHVAPGGVTRPWVRVDGVEVTSDFITFEAPLNVTATGQHVSYVTTLSGAPSAMQTGASTSCTSWTSASNATTTPVGKAERSTSEAWFSGSVPCNSASSRVQCAEMQ
jgi:hypothetical protein